MCARRRQRFSAETKKPATAWLHDQRCAVWHDAQQRLDPRECAKKDALQCGTSKWFHLFAVGLANVWRLAGHGSEPLVLGTLGRRADWLQWSAT